MHETTLYHAEQCAVKMRSRNFKVWSLGLLGSSFSVAQKLVRRAFSNILKILIKKELVLM